MLVDRAPQLTQLAVDLHEHLVEVPLVAEARAPLAQLVSVGLPELGTPAPDRLVADHDTTYQHQLLDLRKAHREPKVQLTPIIVPGQSFGRGNKMSLTLTAKRNRSRLVGLDLSVVNGRHRVVHDAQTVPEPMEADRMSVCELTGREALVTGGRVESVPRWPRPWRGRGDGFGRLDGRTTLKTNDGAHIYVQYNGFLR